MWDADFEPDGHGEQAVELAEDGLLTGFGGDGLQEELAGFARVEMVEKAIDSGLAEAGEFLAEVDEFAHSGVGIVVGALDRCGGAEDIGDQGGVSDFLIGHEFDEESVFGGETGGFEIFSGKSGEAVVEEIKFDPFLV